MKSNIQRAQQRFNASIVELADHDLWRRAVGAAACGAEPGQIEGQLKGAA